MVTPVDSSLYYHGVYWNSFPGVVAYLNRRAFDSDEGSWTRFLLAERGRPYELGFSFNCGNGWVERELVEVGAVERIVAVDYLDDLVRSAAEASVGMPITFVQTDTNRAEFPTGDYDLIINHAAGHHVARIDKVFRELWRMTRPGGTYAMWDYTGPHRNQYEERIWSAATRVNEQLPAEYRSTMSYPHLPTMLTDDPTEAVHSELILEVMARYFRPRHLRRLGGPIAYLVLTHNQALFDAPADQRDEFVELVLAADAAHTAAYPDDSLFTFVLASPRGADELDEAQLEFWSHEEERREQTASVNGGRYYLPTSVERQVYGGSSVDPVTGQLSLSAYEVARRGPRFAAGALARSLVIRLPWLMPPVRAAAALVGRLGLRRPSCQQPDNAGEPPGRAGGTLPG